MKPLVLAFRPPAVPARLTGLAAILLLGWQHQRHQREIESLTERAGPDASRSGDHGAADRDAVAARVSGRRAATHPTAVLDALAIAEPAARIRALLAFAEDVPVTDIAAAIRQLRACSPDWDPDARAAIHLLLTRWAREAPEQALASLREGDPAKNGGDATSIIAGIITIGLLVIQYFLGFVTVIWGESFAGAPFFHYISSQQHLHYFASGLFDTRPVVYFLSVAVFVLFLTYQVVDYRRWKS